MFHKLGVTREPRAHDSGAKGGTGTREYWWETPTRGSTGGEHHQEVRWGASSGSSDREPRTSDGEYR